MSIINRRQARGFCYNGDARPINDNYILRGIILLYFLRLPI